jgi:NAD-dependent deacetylase
MDYGCRRRFLPSVAPFFQSSWDRLSEDELIERTISILKQGNIVAFTGAGISTASGIPDYRGPSGVWRTFDPKDFTIDVFLSNPDYYWSRRIERKKSYPFDAINALPNPAHIALTRLQKKGLLREIITQNTDGLHQKAGSEDVIELHGNASQCICIECKKKYSTSSAEEIAQKTKSAPLCEDCKYPLKPDVVLFGESLNHDDLNRAEAAASKCNSMLVIGTTAVVFPAAAIPRIAKRRGAALIEINQEETELTGRVADLTILGDSSQILPVITTRLA